MTVTNIISDIKSKYEAFKEKLPSTLFVEYRIAFYDGDFEPVDKDDERAAQLYAELVVGDAWPPEEEKDDNEYAVSSILVDIAGEDVTDETLDFQLEGFNNDLDSFINEVTYCPSVLDFLKEKIAEAKKESEEFESDLNKSLSKILITCCIIAVVAAVAIIAFTILRS